MKAINSKMKKMYDVRDNKISISVHTPAYVNIDRDECFEITDNGLVIKISNSKCVVTLWKGTLMQHITIL